MSAPVILRPNPLDQALRLHAMGFSVIPLKPRDKRPALGSWKQYQTARADEAQLRAWFAEGDKNIGIVTGAISNVVVVDGDSAQAVAWIAQNHPSPMRTRTGKGKHFWFLHPARPIRNNAKLRGMDLDVRGDGGYVVAPGSIHPNGAVYEEDGAWDSVWDLPVFDPIWLGEKVQPLGKPAEDLDRRVRRYIESVPGEPEGNRDNAAFRMACKLVRGFAIPEDQALGYLREWNSKCTPPLSDQVLEEKIQSAITSGTEPMGGRAAAGRPEGQVEIPIDDGGSGSWRDRLSRTDKGAIRKTGGNLAKILREDGQWGARLALDEMSRSILYDMNPVEDPFIDWAQERVEDHHGVAFGRDEMAAKLLAQASQRMVHPVREWLRSLVWDGEERIPRLGRDVLHSEDPLTSHYLRCTLVGAVRRVFHPGTKMDTLPVLTGPQGALKSTFWLTLVGKEWFSDSPIDLDSKDGQMVLHRKWCTELAEIDHLTSTKAAERIKAFLSSSEDVFRPPFGRTVVAFRRSCFLVGTANRDGFLVDPTGSRRFWPISCGETLDLKLLGTWRAQLWAEAVNLYNAGAPHWLDSTQERMRGDQARTFEAEDPWADAVPRAIESMRNAGAILSNGVPLSDVLQAMDVPVTQQTRSASMRLSALLKGLGWFRRLAGFDRRAVWHPPEE